MPRTNAGRTRALADVSRRAQDDLLAEGRGGGTTVDAKIQRRLASTAAINKRMADLKRKRSQQPETQQATLPGDGLSSDEEESDDEDMPLPGEVESGDGVLPASRASYQRAARRGTFNAVHLYSAERSRGE